MTVYQMKQCHDDFYLQGGDTQSKTTVSIDRIGKLQEFGDSLHDACRISEVNFFKPPLLLVRLGILMNDTLHWKNLVGVEGIAN